MSYETFVAILIAGASFSIVLTCHRMLWRDTYSWLALPYPFFIAWIIVTWPYIKLVLEWHQ